MNIIYRKNTLYVFLRENVDERVISKMEDRINNIMGTYNIDHLVIRTNGVGSHDLKAFESRYNLSHDSRVLIK